MRKMFPALLMALAAPAAWAVEDYDACLDLVAADATRAEAEAAAWAHAGGGGAARHCRALALIALGADMRAAELLVDIAATDRTLPEQVRATLLVDAGDLFLGLGALDAARAAAARAIQLGAESRPALALSARIKAEAGDWPGAVAELDRALASGEPYAELLALRASARLRLGDRVAARDDLLWATEIAPDLPVVWLERGALAEAEGDLDAARAAWLKAIELSRDDPASPVADAARLRIQKLEAGAN